MLINGRNHKQKSSATGMVLTKSAILRLNEILFDSVPRLTGISLVNTNIFAIFLYAAETSGVQQNTRRIGKSLIYMCQFRTK